MMNSSIKTLLFFSTLTLLSGKTFPGYSREPDSGVESYRTAENDALHPCISESEYTLIRQRCMENAKEYNLTDRSQQRMGSTVTLFDWPLRAAAGLTDCSYYYISAYVDQNISSGSIQDYNCGSNTYDGHHGTDISIWPFNFYKMDNDLVEVIAAAPGIIYDKHDGEFDRNCAMSTLTANYVIIQHSDGSLALYWHMKSGSITSKTIGQSVSAGEYLGVVGSSGSSSGPHLHFEVWTGTTSSTRIDPFSGSCNSLNANSWWAAQKPYKETSIIKVSTHTTDAVFPACPATETSNESHSFQIPFQGPGLAPGYAKFYIFLRNEVSGLTADLSILNPNGSVYLAWNYTSANDAKARAWSWSKLLPTIPGTYTFQAVYNGIACSSTFGIISSTGQNDPEPNERPVLYPNPGNGKFHILNARGRKIRICNVLGDAIFETTIENQQFEFTINVSPGIYFYQITGNPGNTQSGKIIVR